MNLILTKNINNTCVDGYYDGKTAYFTREQIGKALGYSEPTDAISKIHRRNKDRLDKFARVAKLSTPGGTQEMYLYSIKGMLEICRRSEMPKADEIMDKLYDMAEEVLENGFYTTLKPNVLIEKLVEKLDYDHYIEDYILPVLETQDEFCIADLLEQWVGFKVKTKDDWGKAKAIINLKGAERKQRLSKMCYCANDYLECKNLVRFSWQAKDNRGHCKKIRGLWWFDEYILDKLGLSQ